MEYDYVEKLIRKNVEDIVQEKIDDAIVNLHKAAKEVAEEIIRSKAEYVDAVMNTIEVARQMDGNVTDYRIVVEHIMKKEK